MLPPPHDQREAPHRLLLAVAKGAMREPLLESRSRPLAGRLERLEPRLPLSPCASRINPVRRWRLSAGTGPPDQILVTVMSRGIRRNRLGRLPRNRRGLTIWPALDEPRNRVIHLVRHHPPA